MTIYQVTIINEALTATIDQPGPNNPGQRRAALNATCAQLGIVRENGLHGIVVPDGDDDAATVIEFGPGEHNGSWNEQSGKRLRPEQSQAPQSAPGASAKVKVR